ncbi:MAG: glycosyl transferase, partial [Roseovarius gahaiensis]
MGISELRQLGVPRGIPAADKTSIGTDLVRRGVISRSDLELAQIVQRHCDAPLDDILQAEGLSDETSLLAAHAARLGARTASPDDLKTLPEFQSQADPKPLIRHGVLPVTDRDGQPAILTHGAMQMSDVADILPQGTDPTQRRVLLAPRTALQDTIAQRYRHTLTQAAQTRVPAMESCRTWGDNFRRRLGLTLVFLAGLLALSMAFPVAVFGVFVAWASLTLIISDGMKTAAFIARMATGDAALPSAPAPQAGVP